MNSIVAAIQIIFRIFSLIVLANVIFSFFLPPDNPIKTFLEKIVEPFLSPIRRLIPAIGGFDFSPVILLLIVQGVEFLLLQIIR
ncbi:MAG: hypothetical protein C0417_11445 [Chlorobiaceae bacterium]|nr:hypothetical protein [Chlorobiaceae bacterium]